MEFKKCNRCGCFYVSENDVCGNCVPKDRAEMAALNDYLESNGSYSDVGALSIKTGITAKNINRYLSGNTSGKANISTTL